jgi:hypothetical protein
MMITMIIKVSTYIVDNSHPNGSIKPTIDTNLVSTVGYLASSLGSMSYNIV